MYIRYLSSVNDIPIHTEIEAISTTDEITNEIIKTIIIKIKNKSTKLDCKDIELIITPPNDIDKRSDINFSYENFRNGKFNAIYDSTARVVTVTCTKIGCEQEVAVKLILKVTNNNIIYYNICSIVILLYTSLYVYIDCW
jgi:hypothetical protein